ncbi:MAG: peptidylprolyl isomerase [Chloroflexota bacterium]
MAKKKKTEKPQRPLTRRQLSHWQQQQKRQRIVFLAGIFTIVAILLIIGGGWVYAEYLPLQQTVIRVNDTEFDMQYYIDVLKIEFQRSQQPPAQYAQYLADTAVNDIEQAELVRQGALKLGVSVSDDNVTAQLDTAGLPNDAAYRDLVRGQLLLPKMRDEYFDKRLPATAEQVHMLAMFLESQSVAANVTARLEAGESFASLYTSVGLGYGSSDGDLGWHIKEVFDQLIGSTVASDYAFGASAEAGSLSPPLYDADLSKGIGYWLIKVLSRDENTGDNHILAMLLGSEEEAQGIRARLEAGEDFSTLAKESSRLDGAKDDGGDLGTVAPGDKTDAFDQFTFDTSIAVGTLSEPIKDKLSPTKGGYWLVQVVEKDANREIAEGDRNVMNSTALNDWVTSLKNDPSNTVDDSYLTDERKAWAAQKALKELGL